MEPEEELHSFQFCQEVSGVEHDYRITENANHIFGVEKDGVVIAELTNDKHWLQLSGKPLDNDLFQKICDRIEDHYVNNPALIQITRDDGSEQPIDIFPVYRQDGDLYVATQAFRIYVGYPAEEGEDFEERLEEYLEYVELEGEAHPGFLGELHFQGMTAFEWKYLGERLSEAEVLQVVDVLQDHQPVFLSGNDPDTKLSFTYDRFNERKYIQLMADEGRFLVFINGGFAAEIELMETDWEITSGELLEPGLEKEILRRIVNFAR